MDNDTIIVEHQDGRTSILLNRPEVMNSLDADMVERFHSVLDECADSRVVVIRGEGRGFSAGRDLSNAEPLEEDARSILADLFNPLIARIRTLPMPTIAAVHGPALGVGFGIAMACDLVVASERSRLGSPFANIGCVLDSGGHAALVQRVGPHRALELIYTGRLLDGAAAAAMGLVNEVVDADDLDDRVAELAEQIGSGPTAAFAASKRIVHAVADSSADFDQVLDAEADAQGRLAGGPDYVEGIGAFMEKRPPRFVGS
ncbi:MAG: enoyl-CoA hydratase-related protein [Ilumatobacter sp.]|uniref:enoyl-CoA hydratase/isomerase family protein n=1 Tax=Ilumatobacter sp. TaxID=1967498 RepID=UPI003C714CAA